MKIKSKSILFIVISILGIIVISWFLFSKYFFNYISPKVREITSIDANLNDESANVIIRMLIANESGIAVYADSLHLTLEIDGKKYASGKRGPRILKAHTEDTIAIPFTLKYRSLLKKIKRSQNIDSLPFRITINMFYHLPVIKTIMIPIVKEGKLKVPIPPVIEVEKVKLKSPGLSESKMSAIVHVINENNFGMVIKHPHYDLHIEGLADAKGNLDYNINVPGHSNIEFEIPFNIKIKQLIKNVIKIIADKDQYKYHLKLDGAIKMEFKVGHHIDVHLEKSGEVEVVK